MAEVECPVPFKRKLGTEMWRLNAVKDSGSGQILLYLYHFQNDSWELVIMENSYSIPEIRISVQTVEELKAEIVSAMLEHGLIIGPQEGE